MPKPCSLELRERVVEAVESGASRREGAEWFDVSPSSAIKWMQRRQRTARQPRLRSVATVQITRAARHAFQKLTAHRTFRGDGMTDAADLFCDSGEPLNRLCL